MKENLVGGPSIIMHHEAGKTRPREMEYGTESLDCQAIIGLDANVLYLYSLMNLMPTG